jgi:hypothetical protein
MMLNPTVLNAFTTLAFASPLRDLLAGGSRRTELQALEPRQQRIHRVNQDFAAQIAESLDDLPRGGPRHREQDNIAGLHGVGNAAGAR